MDNITNFNAQAMDSLMFLSDQRQSRRGDSIC